MTADPLLELRNLSCERDDRWLFSALDLSISPGELVQVIGPNGAGKTTLLRIITGISSDYEGDITWRGRPLRRQRHQFQRELLYIGHNTGIKKALTPTENLSFYRTLGGGFAQPVEELLAQVGLAGFEDVPCYQLSAGQQRRVALARLYGSKADLWVLDEPFTAIDQAGVAALESRLAQHLAQGGCAVLTSHQSLQLGSVRQLDLSQFAGAAV